MSLARTALRLLVVELLKSKTLAEKRVYDSRMSDLAPDAFSEDAKATLIIYTEDDQGDALSEQNGGPPFKRMIDLVIEIGMVERTRAGEDGSYVVGYPDTDPRLEASIDFVEHQISAQFDSIEALPTLFRKLVRIWHHDRKRHGTEDASVKIAARLLTLTCEISDDQRPVISSGAAPPTGNDRLPEPLRAVANALPEASYGLQICASLAAAIGNPEAVTPFEGLGIVIDAGTGSEPSHIVEADILLDQP